MSDDMYNEIYGLKTEMKNIKEILSQIKSELVNLRSEIRKSQGGSQQFSFDENPVKKGSSMKPRNWG